MWFRVELNKDGSVSTCTHVEARSTEAGRQVYYIEAESDTFACASAVSRYKAYIDRQRESMVERRAARKAAGLCRECQKPVGNGKLRCAECLAHERDIRYHGKPAGTRGVVRPVVLEQRLEAAGRSQRERILQEVLDAALSMRAGLAFISWLRNQLMHARSTRVAAAE